MIFGILHNIYNLIRHSYFLTQEFNKLLLDSFNPVDVNLVSWSPNLGGILQLTTNISIIIEFGLLFVLETDWFTHYESKTQGGIGNNSIGMNIKDKVLNHGRNLDESDCV